MEYIIYIIDYSKNKDFRKKCFDLLKYDLESKIISNSKCEIQFILSSMKHSQFPIENDFNFPGTVFDIIFKDSVNS